MKWLTGFVVTGAILAHLDGLDVVGCDVRLHGDEGAGVSVDGDLGPCHYIQAPHHWDVMSPTMHTLSTKV